MSVPPQGGWQPGPIPPNQGQPYGQPFDPSGYSPQQQPPPPGWQQGSWGQQPAPPPPKGGGLKWLLIAVAVLLVVAVSIGATLLFTRDSGGGGSTPTSGAPSDVASANDTGPVSIITEEPTCNSFVGINNSLGDVQKAGWSDERASLGPASEWSPQQRVQVQAVATAMLNATDQVVALSKQTPHRLVRELYGQFVAYGRAYADSVTDYKPIDDALASANVNASSALIGICNTITFGSASRSVSVKPPPPPTEVADAGDLTNPKRFIEESDSTCRAWVSRLDDFNTETADWEKLDSNIPATEWTPERQLAEQSVQPVITSYADDIEEAGRQSGNAVLEDFGTSAALYLWTYVTVGKTYTSRDSWLSYTGFRIANLVSGACRAVSR